MAAGRIDVSGRGGFCRFSKGDFDDYRNDVHDVVLDQVAVGNNRHNTRSSVPKLNYRSGFNCRDEEFWGGNGLGDTSRVKYGGLYKHEDGVQLPSDKKRKSSLIIWDKEDKKVRISSKNRVTSRIVTLTVPPPLARRHHQGADVAFNGGIAVDAVLTRPVVGPELMLDKDSMAQDLVDGIECQSPATLPHPSLQEEYQANDVMQDQEKEEEIAEVRNLSMSRWASDGDSPIDASLNNCEYMPENSAYSKDSTPESGELLEEALEREQPCGFDERDHKVESGRQNGHFLNKLENDDVMEVDKIESNEDFDDSKEPIAANQRSVNMLNCCRSVFEYEKLNEINEGTYGKVYRARDKKSGEIVALKKVKMDVGRDKDLEEWGFPLTSLREINILLSFHHPSIVNVKEVVMDDLNGVFMVMEYMEHDLKGLMQKMKQPFSTSEVKCLMLQLLEGVKCLHDNWVLHRDLKTSNLLLNNQGDLKLCDFGMSRQYGSPLKQYTSLVITLWYRAPELLLGAKEYSTAVDMWSVGCIMAELLSKEPLFKGKNEVDQLDKIYRTLGTPNELIWPGLSKLPGAKANFRTQPYNLLRKKFPATSFTGSPVLSDLGFDLLNSLLTFDPKKRITADAALSHAWFQEVPLPKSKDFMPTFPPPMQ